jgi:AcrR family transcriptional regulator
MTERSVVQQLRERRRAERALQIVRPDTRTAILVATEQILSEAPLHDVSVARIMAEAEVSRATFYSYFASKFEVLAGLLELVMDDMYDLVRQFVVRAPGRSRASAIREMLVETTQLWSRHRAVFRATHEHWHAVPELRTQWLRVMERFTDAVALELDREIESGAAPRGIDTRQRAAGVLWASEQLLYIAATGADADLPNEPAILETLLALWTGTLLAPPPSATDPDAETASAT